MLSIVVFSFLLFNNKSIQTEVGVEERSPLYRVGGSEEFHYL